MMANREEVVTEVLKTLTACEKIRFSENLVGCQEAETAYKGSVTSQKLIYI